MNKDFKIKNSEDTLKDIYTLLLKIKEKTPLVHHITNYVTVNDCANMTLAIGASPVMAHAIEEVEDMVSLASALVMNIGTIDNDKYKAMILAGKKANDLGIPVILDPVGLGATPYRNSVVCSLLENVHFTVIKGNMSEIKSLSGISGRTKGVDSIANMDGAEGIALELSKKLNTIIGITGKKDIICDGKNIACIENGHVMLSKITGTGCMTASLLGAFVSVTEDYFLSTIGAILSMNIGGEKAFENLKSEETVGSFKVRLFDSIYTLNENEYIQRGKINIYEFNKSYVTKE